MRKLIFILAILLATSAIAQQRWGRGGSWGRDDIAWGRGVEQVLWTPLNVRGWSHLFIASPANCGVGVGANCPSWLELMLSGNNAFQGTGADQPKLIQVGNKYALEFDGGNEFMTVHGNDTAGEFTYFTILRTSESGASNRNNLYGHSTIGIYTGSFTFNVNVNEAWLNMKYSGTNRSLYSNVKPEVPSPNTVQIYLIYVAGAAGGNRPNDRVYKNGVTVSPFFIDNTATNIAWGNLLLCRSNAWYGKLDIFEFGVYPGAMPESDRKQLEAYSKRTYGSP